MVASTTETYVVVSVSSTFLHIFGHFCWFQHIFAHFRWDMHASISNECLLQLLLSMSRMAQERLKKREELITDL